MELKKILRIKIYQPHAHYRIPFTFSRRHTYPIPPYSTVIGFLCNVLGIQGPIEKPGEYFIKSLENITFKEFADGLYISIYGKFESITKEYIWFRNLHKEKHKERFYTLTNRTIHGEPEHPGGQIPAKIDVLENVYLIIYLAHENEEVIYHLQEILRKPDNRVYPLHLGRAEDWIVFDGKPEESIKIIKTEEKELYGRLDFYTWIPDYRKREEKEEFEFVGIGDSNKDNYKNFFEKVQGSSHIVTSFYRLQNGIRVFQHIPVKLFEGGSFPLNFGKPFKFSIDAELKLPIFFAKMKYPEV